MFVTIILLYIAIADRRLILLVSVMNTCDCIKGISCDIIDTHLMGDFNNGLLTIYKALLLSFYISLSSYVCVFALLLTTQLLQYGKEFIFSITFCFCM